MNKIFEIKAEIVLVASSHDQNRQRKYQELCIRERNTM
jgi:hypothetical protein